MGTVPGRRTSSWRSISARTRSRPITPRAAVLDLDAPQLKGNAMITAKPSVAAIARHRSRCARPQRIRHRSEVLGRAGPRAGGVARAGSRGRGGGRPGAIRGIGDRRVACAAAAEGQDIGNRTGCRGGRYCRAVGAGRQGERQSQGSQRRSGAAARSQAVRHTGAENRAVVAGFACGQQIELRRSRQHHCRLAAARAPGAGAGR